jgi:ABC-2 type transport system ATP-binding protein
MEPIIKVSGLTKDFAGEQALKGVDLLVPQGCLYGLIGADGAGKSTLLQILTTLIPPAEGSATVLGFDIRTRAASIRTALGYMPQKFSLYHDLTVMENLSFFADIFGVTGQERRARVEQLLSFARLQQFTSRRAGNLSGGMKQKLALSCALVHQPALLILDEPTIGVDPASRREFWALLKQLTADGRTILVSTPYMDETDYCDRLAVLHQGRVLQEGTPRELTGRFPLSLYEVVVTQEALLDSATPLPEGIVRLYYAGGGIRVAFEQGVSLERVLTALATVLPGVKELRQLEPQMEDVFIHLLSEEAPADGKHD